MLSTLLNNKEFRSFAYQLLLVVSLVAFVWWIANNTVTNLQQRSIASGFGFLDTTAGFALIQSLVDYEISDSYLRAIIVGFLNTLLVAFIGIIFATLLGFIVGIARLSKTLVIRSVATTYIEVIRNVPLLLQIFFWYFAVLSTLAGPREKMDLIPGFFINVRGLFGPKPIIENGFGLLVMLTPLIGIVVSLFLSRWAKKRLFATGKTFPVLWTAIGLIFVAPFVLFFAFGMPIGLEHPNFVSEGPVLRRGFEIGVGMKFIPELMSLVLALTMYTAAFIAEIVRAGILAVSHGQTEAASALGLRPNRTMQLVIIPQALRVIIPPLTSQYLNLTKNSSLAVAIAYPDLVAVGGTVINQSGQAIEVVAIWMLVYLSISLLTSALMNVYNRAVAIVER